MNYLLAYALIGLSLCLFAFRGVRLTMPIATRLTFALLWPLAFIPTPEEIKKLRRKG